MELQLPPGAMLVELMGEGVMGFREMGMVANLCAALADCIDHAPKAAAFVARKLAGVLSKHADDEQQRWVKEQDQRELREQRELLELEERRASAKIRAR